MIDLHNKNRDASDSSFLEARIENIVYATDGSVVAVDFETPTGAKFTETHPICSGILLYSQEHCASTLGKGIVANE